MESYKIATKVAKEIIDEERGLREKAEKERDQAEYDREYYATQLMEYIPLYLLIIPFENFFLTLLQF